MLLNYTRKYFVGVNRRMTYFGYSKTKRFRIHLLKRNCYSTNPVKNNEVTNNKNGIDASRKENVNSNIIEVNFL
jgi:hypothetical protein